MRLAKPRVAESRMNCAMAGSAPCATEGKTAKSAVNKIIDDRILCLKFRIYQQGPQGKRSNVGNKFSDKCSEPKPLEPFCNFCRFFCSFSSGSRRLLKASCAH